jgi:hypothetical protein
VILGRVEPLSPETTRAVADALAAWVRADPTRDSSELRRLLVDLSSSLSARTSDVSERSTPIDATWLTPREMVVRFGKSERTWRRRAKAGTVKGRKGDDGGWRIESF